MAKYRIALIFSDKESLGYLELVKEILIKIGLSAEFFYDDLHFFNKTLEMMKSTNCALLGNISKNGEVLKKIQNYFNLDIELNLFKVLNESSYFKKYNELALINMYPISSNLYPLPNEVRITLEKYNCNMEKFANEISRDLEIFIEFYSNKQLETFVKSLGDFCYKNFYNKLLFIEDRANSLFFNYFLKIKKKYNNMELNLINSSQLGEWLTKKKDYNLSIITYYPFLKNIILNFIYKSEKVIFSNANFSTSSNYGIFYSHNETLNFLDLFFSIKIMLWYLNEVELYKNYDFYLNKFLEKYDNNNFKNEITSIKEILTSI